MPSPSNPMTVPSKTSIIDASTETGWFHDFTLSVNRDISAMVGTVLLIIWLIGMMVMITRTLRSLYHLRKLKQSALPLQNKTIQSLFNNCLTEMEIRKNLPVYSTAFLKSPMIAGIWNPCIYLPLHLISDYRRNDMRYILLHELQHYKHKDGAINYLMNIAGIVYWFHPLVRYALREMKDDREIACDSGVLEIIDPKQYEEYGNTLINFAEKISQNTFPFASALGGNISQLKRRILNIASYEKPDFRQKIRGMAAFGVIVLVLICFIPFVSVSAFDENHYQWDPSDKNIIQTDFSPYFGKYKGSFVLYDMTENSWKIYNPKNAATRTSPDSTYKIYNALFALQNKIITPKNSFMKWNGKKYPFKAWNTDQTLQSAMKSSVNWYFENIDHRLGASAVSSYLKNINYGNESVYGTFPSHWMESSLKISPMEQVELLIKFHQNSFHFHPENIKAVKQSILLLHSERGDFYGKTGTGRVNGQDINGWFIGFVERKNRTYFFATNIQSEKNATGRKASEISFSILSDLHIWK